MVVKIINFHKVIMMLSMAEHILLAPPGMQDYIRQRLEILSMIDHPFDVVTPNQIKQHLNDNKKIYCLMQYIDWENSEYSYIFHNISVENIYIDYIKDIKTTNIDKIYYRFYQTKNNTLNIILFDNYRDMLRYDIYNMIHDNTMGFNPMLIEVLLSTKKFTNDDFTKIASYINENTILPNLKILNIPEDGFIGYRTSYYLKLK